MLFMRTLISGKGGLAAIYQGNEAHLYASNGELLDKLSLTATERVFTAFDDTIIYENRSKNKNEVIAKLKYEKKKTETLMLVLTSLDAFIDNSEKSDILKYAEESLQDNEVRSYIQKVLYSNPLPENVIPISSINLKIYPNLYNLISDLYDSQISIREIHECWINEVVNKIDFKDRIAASGAFSLANVGFYLSRATKQDVFDGVKFELWTKLSKYRVFVSSFFQKSQKNILPIIKDTKRIYKSDEAQQKNDNDGFIKTKTKPHELYTQAQSEIEAIKNALYSGDVNKAERYANQLFERQINKGDKSYASKSLSSLSEYAKVLGNYKFMIKWANQAVEANPTDIRAHAQLADSYLLMGDYDSAWKCFDKCKTNSLKYEAYSYGGFARIHRARHEYESALEMIIKALDTCDYDSVNACIKAEILGDMRRHAEAESIYKKLLRDFEDVPAIYCGLARIFEEQRNFSEAEATYRDAIEKFPEEQIPIGSLGFFLVKQGKFTEGLRCLDLAINLSVKGDFANHYAKATALKMCGRYHDAELVLRKVIESTNDAIDTVDAYVGLVELLGQSKREQEALELCEQYEISHTNSKILRAKASILRKLGRTLEGLAIVNTLASSSPTWTQILCDKADILRGLGQLDESKDIYKRVLALNKFEKRALKGLRLIDAIQKVSNPNSVFIDSSIEKKITLDDWEEFSIQGLILLSEEKYSDAKKVFLECEKSSPFIMIKEDSNIPLTASRIGLKQYRAALENIKRLKGDTVLLQKAMLYNQLSNFEKLKSVLLEINKNADQVVSILPLIEKYCDGTRANDEHFSEIFNEHITSILKAA
jgi:tetratricopeptide (TPR) repeat protein